jgi:hypothetical protein
MVVRRERGEGIGGMQGGLLNEARENESGVRTTVERKKYGTKERRHRPRRRDLGKTGGDGGSEGEAGKESWARTQLWRLFLNWLLKFPPAGTVIRPTRRNEGGRRPFRAAVVLATLISYCYCMTGPWRTKTVSRSSAPMLSLPRPLNL